MNFFQQFEALVKAGVVFHITLRPGAQNMQLEILPVCDTGKTGIAIPPRVLVATAAELDEKVPDFLVTYLASAANLADQIAITKVVMEKAVHVPTCRRCERP